MRTLNRVELIGNVGSDPEVRETTKGTPVANVSLATNDGWGDHEETTWHRIVAFGKRADIVAEYVRKGQPIYVDGELRKRTYEAADGSERHAVEVVAEEIILLGRAPRDAREGPGGQPAGATADPDDSLPF